MPFEAGNHAPEFMIVRHEPEAGCVLVTMHLTSHQVLTRLLKLDPAWTLEEMWDKGKRAWDAKDTLGMTPEETALGNRPHQKRLIRLMRVLFRGCPGFSV